ncbi:Craniofacial development protein 2 [Schistosoma haematobium]|uniref:Craniofacial development protein 2 n=1 Tax=Schistosoma haematobium TaxID=6185 RepID=A0A922M042_SCHHA|nr:Craniofacial development protein 2 [Schistosoma haematobium]KAH9596983.1 Craniofacial development protein 2 [Schistosoma haematobium]
MGSHGPTIIKASFQTKKEGISMNVIQCYAPTNDYNEDAKDQFYNRLQSIIETCPTKDLTILMGDFNAKVGTDNTGYEDIMGRQGPGERNENGERFANLCAFNKLVIGGTIFPYKRIHKTTWTSPDHYTQNQIDHIYINKTFRRTIEDVRTKRGADIASDHHLLVAKMKLKLKKHWTMGRTHIEESTQLHHKLSPHMESSRSSEEKRKTKEHITPRNGDRHEKSGQELDGTRKEGPGQSELENGGRRPMLHWE